jgi:hypothetical protein
MRARDYVMPGHKPTSKGAVKSREHARRLYVPRLSIDLSRGRPISRAADREHFFGDVS